MRSRYRGLTGLISFREGSLILLLLSALWPLDSAAQQPPVNKDAQALSVLQQSLTTMNSAAGVLLDSIAQGTITFNDGTSASISIKSRGTDKLHHDISFPTTQLSYVINGGSGYRVQDGVKEVLPLHVTAYQRVEYIPALSRIVECTNFNTNVVYVGLETLASGQAHHIKLTNVASNPKFATAEALNSEFHAFVDPNTSLVVKTTSFIFSPTAIENRFPVDSYYSDYRNINGVLVPFHMTRFVSGQKYSDLQLSIVQIDTGLNSDSDFQ